MYKTCAVVFLHCWVVVAVCFSLSLVLQTRTLNCTHIFAVGVLVFEVEAFVNTFAVFCKLSPFMLCCVVMSNII